MPTPQIVTFKRASTFGAACTYIPEQGNPPDLDGVTITSDIRDAKGELYICDVVITDPTHFNITYPDSSKWALGSAYWDIKFSRNGSIFYSDTVVLNIINNITI